MQAGIVSLLESGIAPTDSRARSIVYHGAVDEARRTIRLERLDVNIPVDESDPCDELAIVEAIETAAEYMTDAQAAVCALMVRDVTQDEIARRLGVSRSTIVRLIA